MRYWNTLTLMTARTIRSRAELIATERLALGMRSRRWQGRLRTHCFLPEKRQTSAATTEPYMTQSPAEGEWPPSYPGYCRPVSPWLAIKTGAGIFRLPIDWADLSCDHPYIN